MEKSVKLKNNKLIYRSLAIVFWLLAWELISRLMDIKYLLASPTEVLVTLGRLSMEVSFWITIANSTLRILAGFLLALISGIILAVLSYRWRAVHELVTPVIQVIKATPVASFIILALLWISEKNLSILISFLIVLPVIYSNVFQGLNHTDSKLLEMAKVFRLNRLKKIKAIYLPAVLPYFISAVSVGLGFSFKAGIAAEVIGYPSRSIGQKLYEAKLYLMTKELFAWSIVIIIISVLFEKAVMVFIRYFYKSDPGN